MNSFGSFMCQYLVLTHLGIVLNGAFSTTASVDGNTLPKEVCIIKINDEKTHNGPHINCTFNDGDYITLRCAANSGNLSLKVSYKDSESHQFQSKFSVLSGDEKAAVEVEVEVTVTVKSIQIFITTTGKNAIQTSITGNFNFSAHHQFILEGFHMSCNKKCIYDISLSNDKEVDYHDQQQFVLITIGIGFIVLLIIVLLSHILMIVMVRKSYRRIQKLDTTQSLISQRPGTSPPLSRSPTASGYCSMLPTTYIPHSFSLYSTQLTLSNETLNTEVLGPHNNSELSYV